MPKTQTAFQVNDWFDLARPSKILAPGGNGSQTNLNPPVTNAEEMTVYSQRRNRDAEWRLDIQARRPAYEATNSDAAQPIVPYPEWSSPEQQRLMSIKTDALGLCGALGGYIQCPNKPP